MRILNSAEVAQLLDMPSCIDAVEEAFRARRAGRPAASASLGLPLVGGTLHAKLARLDRARSYVAAKINANLPRNPIEEGLPTIQGVLVLIDARAGVDPFAWFRRRMDQFVNACHGCVRLMHVDCA